VAVVLVVLVQAVVVALAVLVLPLVALAMAQMEALVFVQLLPEAECFMLVEAVVAEIFLVV